MDIDVFRARIAHERKTIRHDPPASLNAHYTITQKTLSGSPCYSIKSKRDTRGSILYLHGGCYVFEITPHHWQFCAWLADSLNVEVVVPIYPLAPEHDVDEALAMAIAAYRAIKDNDITIMGDSAGGGMALALAQQVAKDNTALTKPKHIVLLSPWVDVAMSNTDVPKADERDPWLSKVGLVEAGRMYRGDKQVEANDPRVSPIYGSLENIGSISIFIGTRDVLYPDALLLRDRARGEATLYEYPEMVHDFMLIDFLPEAKRARADIVKLLLTSQRPANETK